MRLPNGFGNVSKLSGKRRNPWRARKTSGWTIDEKTKKAIGILQYTNEKGEIAEHLPDDTRHTFTTMWKEKRLDEAMRRKIQGHSGKGIGEIVYTHFELEKLREELNRL